MRSSMRRLVSLSAVSLLLGGLISVAAPAAAGAAPPEYVPASCNRDLPAAKAGAVPRMRCFAVSVPSPARGLAAGPVPGALAPADIRQAYQLPDGGDGMTVAIVDAYGY